LPEDEVVHPWRAPTHRATANSERPRLSVRPIFRDDYPYSIGLRGAPTLPVDDGGHGNLDVAKYPEDDREAWLHFDSWLEEYLAVVRFPSTRRFLAGWPPIGTLIRPFCRWYISHALVLGASPLPLATRTPKWRISRLRREWSMPFVATGRYGLFVPKGGPSPDGTTSPSSRGVLLDIEDTSIWPSYDNGFFSGYEKPMPLTPNGHPCWNNIATDMMRMLAGWRMPFYTGDSNRPRSLEVVEGAAVASK
jgi:hypothetical protein